MVVILEDEDEQGELLCDSSLPVQRQYLLLYEHNEPDELVEVLLQIDETEVLVALH